MTKELQEGTVSSRFTDLIIKEASATSDMVQFTPYKKKLAQHMFIKIDAQLKDLEAKRVSSGKQVATYTWENINMEKLAIDTVHRVDLGLDALIPNHIHPIPYFNKKKEKYDLDLRIGFKGKDYYRRKMACDEPVNIVYELVYSNDEFKVNKRGMNQDFDSYEFEIKNPFDRGKVVGGFGYIVYEKKEKNELVIVAESDFISSKNCAKSKDFWNKNPVEMRFKTLVHRTTEKLNLDPEKVNASFLMVDSSDNDDDVIEITQEEITQNANSEVIDIPQEEPGEMSDDEKQDIVEQEQAQEPKRKCGF